MTEILEAAMLICFGLSWPISVVKNYKAGTAKNMSLRFTLLIITGYLCGITAKIVSGRYNFVLAVYLLNLAVVSLNVLVYSRNKKLDAASSKSQVKRMIVNKEAV